MNIKTLGYVMALGGFVLIIAAAGSSDFYEECRLAADCVAGEPQTTFEMVAQAISGLILMAIGVKIIID